MRKLIGVVEALTQRQNDKCRAFTSEIMGKVMCHQSSLPMCEDSAHQAHSYDRTVSWQMIGNPLPG